MAAAKASSARSTFLFLIAAPTYFTNVASSAANANPGTNAPHKIPAAISRCMCRLLIARE